MIGEAPSRRLKKKSLNNFHSKFFALASVSFERWQTLFQRGNLLDEWPGRDGKGSAFDPERGRRRALTIMRLIRKYRVAVLFGRRVQKSFGLGYLNWLESTEISGCRVFVFPHPSGVNLWWNKRENRDAAAKTLREVLELAI